MLQHSQAVYGRRYLLSLIQFPGQHRLRHWHLPVTLGRLTEAGLDALQVRGAARACAAASRKSPRRRQDDAAPADEGREALQWKELCGRTKRKECD